MKIAGVISNYHEALDIEEIVKVFLVKKRIFNILSLEKTKNFEKNNQNFTTYIKDDVKLAPNSNGKSTHFKNSEDQTHVFNVRGLL